MKTIICFMFTILFGAQAFANQSECFLLREYFGKDPALIQEKLDFYEKRIKTGNDEYDRLAISILYCAMARIENCPVENAAQNGVDSADTFLSVYPSDSMGLLFSGLAHSLLSRTLINPFTKFSEIKRAIAQMDIAVNQASGTDYEWYIRCMRCSSYCQIPKFLDKDPVVIADYQKLETYFEGHHKNRPYQIALNYYMGIWADSRKDAEQARTYWQKAVNIQKQETYIVFETSLAQNKLKEMDGSK